MNSLSYSILNQELFKSKKVKIKKNVMLKMIATKDRLNIFTSFQKVWRFTGTYYYCVVAPASFTYLKRNWGHSNNFCLRWSFFVIKQNAMNQKFKTFTCKLQLAYYVTLAWSTSLMLWYNLIIHNFFLTS